MKIKFLFLFHFVFFFTIFFVSGVSFRTALILFWFNFFLGMFFTLTPDPNLVKPTDVGSLINRPKQVHFAFRSFRDPAAAYGLRVAYNIRHVVGDRYTYIILDVRQYRKNHHFRVPTTVKIRDVRFREPVDKTS